MSEQRFQSHARPEHFGARRWVSACVLGACVFSCSTSDPAPAAGGSSGAGGGGADGVGGSGGSALDLSALECGPPPMSSGEFSKQALLEAAADCGIWHYCQFDASARELARSVRGYAESGGSAELDAAQTAWRAAMLAWARAELFQFGPAGSRALDPYHGASYRDRIYAWPATSRCRVEEQIVREAPPEDLDQVLVSGKGLFALEYLLFYTGSDTACAPSSSTASQWATLDADALAQRKRDYARLVSDNVAALIAELRARWEPSGGNFRQTLVDATGYERAGTDRDQEALNVVAWSLVYAEKEVKDYKVGPHTGKMLPATPVDGFESPHAGLAQPIVLANLEGVRSLYQGCGEGGAGIGFDDWLQAAGHGELAGELEVALTGALSAVDAFPAFSEASEAEFATLYDSGVKPLTDLIKNDLMAGNGSALNLTLPASAAADND